jgi:ribonuclease Z
VSNRELVVLGTASQQPTRLRNHSGYVLLWDDEAILVDPGEGTQRQLLIAGVRPTRLTRICITHLHGDHCLGLPGVVALLSQLPMPGPVSLHFPASGTHQIERLLDSVIIDNDADLRLEPVLAPAVVVDRPRFRLTAEPLDHSTDAVGWRVETPASTHLRPDRLQELGVSGSAIGSLIAHGEVSVGGPTVRLADVTDAGPANVAAFVFDTRWCPGAIALARDADLLVCESTFLDVDARRAHEYGHLTAGEAGTLAAVAGADRLVLTHFSGRYGETDAFAVEARRHHPDVIQATDLLRIAVPRRPRPGQPGRSGRPSGSGRPDPR